MNYSRIVAAAFLLSMHPSLPAQEPAPADELKVIDLRPPEEKDGVGLLPLEGKCNKDVFRIADVASDPLKVDVLKRDLEYALPVSAERKTLTVLNWSIYYNKQINKGGGGFLKNVGVQGYSVPAQEDKGKQPGSKCSQKESGGGWYEGKEVTGIYFPLVSEFTGTFGGKPVKVRVVFSPGRKLEGKFAGGELDTQALIDTVHKTAEELVIALQ